LQRINHVEVIFHIQVFYDERCSSRTRINFHAALINWKRPEPSVIQTRIKIVYLIAEVRGRPPHVQVDSNERKRALMVAPVSSDVFAVHEPHVPSQTRGVSAGGVTPPPDQLPRISVAPRAPLKSVMVASSGEFPGRQRGSREFAAAARNGRGHPFFPTACVG